MFDVSKVYGLGYILNLLSDSEVVVEDFGYYYLIEADRSPDLNNVPKLSILTGKDLPWRTILLTLKGKQRENKIKEIENALKDKNFISKILNKSQKLEAPLLQSSKNRSTETLYQSLELGATKGFREPVKGKRYTEGTQLYISREDFILSVIGHLHFTIWKQFDDKTISILLNPGIEGVNIGPPGSLKDLKDGIEKAVKNHKAGFFVTLSNTAINLAKKIYEMKTGKYRFLPRFSSLTYGVMKGAGQQMKPYGGGIYPLDFLYKIVDSLPDAGKIFDMWIDTFNQTNREGYEDLPIFLSEFVTHPSFESFERYIKIHLQYYLDGKMRLPLYEEKSLEEVIKCLE